MLGQIISGGMSLIGGLMGRDDAKTARQLALNSEAENRAMQYDFAKNGIRWRVADAKEAGVHPIYALGASTPSFSPVSTNFAADTSLPNAMAAAGQDIGRAINSTRSQDERIVAFTKAARALQLENMSLQNENLRTEIASKTARLGANQSGPPMPAPGDAWLIPGQPPSGPSGSRGPLFVDTPLKRAPGDPWKLSQEGGAITDTGHARTSGGLFPVPSDDVKQRIEDNFYQETMHFIRNNLLPMISPKFNQPPHPASKGNVWVYDPVYGYKEVPDRWLNRFLRNKVVN